MPDQAAMRGTGSATLQFLGIGRNALRAPLQRRKCQCRCEIETTHRPDDAVQAQQRNQPESAGQRTREGS